MCCTLQIRLNIYKNVNDWPFQYPQYPLNGSTGWLCHAISNPAEHRFVKSTLRYRIFSVLNEGFQSIPCNQEASVELGRHKKQKCEFSHSSPLNHYWKRCHYATGIL